MKPLTAPLKRILQQLLLLLACYFISRICFTLINVTHFSGLTIGGFFKLCFYALRYDLSAIFALNALYFLLLLLPLPLWRMPRWVSFTQVIFVGINVLALLFELSDWAYYPYNFKRSTADVLKMIGRKGDFWNLLPRFLIDYWYVPLAIVLFVFCFIKINRRICKATPLDQPPQRYGPALIGGQLLRLVVAAGISLIAIRGGLQYIPIGLRNAVQVAESRYVPVVINTPFSIISSYATPGLEEVQYMSEADADAVIHPVKDYRDAANPFRRKNVVLIILESFSKEFTRLGGGTSYTPFLDSLMDHTRLCTQAYANGLHSAAGIPAIIAGIPTLMEEAFTTSNYGTNRIDALPGLLRKKGYETAFYHGGTNGTMSFDIFAAAAGYDHYYGRKEYNNEKDYDGNWGIPDEPFLQYFAAGLNQMKQPFAASVFTLSSHPPYTVPAQYRQRFGPGKLPIYAVIRYSDYALRRFFETASKQPWYRNTLFVITADHCSPQTGGGYYDANMGRYAIPVMFYAPGDSSIKGTQEAPVQQLDILPSVLDYLHYDQRFFAFGNSIFRKDAPRYVVNENNGSYQWLKNGYLLQTKEVQATGLFRFPQDSLCQHNESTSAADAARQLYEFKAFLQLYRSALIHNKMSAP